jgi:photosystem I reaction center subunit VIII
MTASFLPAIMTPIVGIVFPGISMALWFIFIQKDDDAPVVKRIKEQPSDVAK